MLSFKKYNLIANWELLYYDKEIVVHLNFSVGRNRRTCVWNFVIRQKYVLCTCSKWADSGLVDKMSVGNGATDHSGGALAPAFHSCSWASLGVGGTSLNQVLPAHRGKGVGFWMWSAACPHPGTFFFEDLFLSYSIIFIFSFKKCTVTIDTLYCLVLSVKANDTHTPVTQHVKLCSWLAFADGTV